LLSRIKERCPELLDAYIESALFKLPENTSNNTPQGMAQKFSVPYLGKLPMDPNMMRACEEGKSFLELFPDSTAASAFREVVNRLVMITDRIQ
jgi:nitrogenase subunit NifH